MPRNGLARGKAQRGWTTATGDHEHEVLQPQVIGEVLQTFCMGRHGKVSVRGPVAQAEAQMVGHDAAVRGRKGAHQVTEAEAPVGRAVHEEDHRTRPFVHTVHASVGVVEVAGREGEFAAIQPIGVDDGAFHDAKVGVRLLHRGRAGWPFPWQ